ncbi:MAG: glycoside hydrolase family 3 N-terminal domain-containing protein [Bacteroidales bacterium]|nr:glycoside hydrolase family 3 N-terminal domain-containing protein [Bacteroidales bacterium]
MSLRLKKIYIPALVALVAAAAVASPRPAGGKDTISPAAVMKAAQSPEARAWADSVYATLTERQRVAQLMCPKVVTARGANTLAQVRSLVKNEGVGALLFTEGTAAEHAEAINLAQELARVPVLITADGEWGPAMRVSDIASFPRNMALGAISNDSLIYDYGRETARQCLALGMTVNFAPVADVNSNPRNPVIGSRAFGDDPDNVTRKVCAYSRGLEDGGMQSVAKHFPGHGDTESDSHKTLPFVGRSMEELEQVELVPFRGYVNSGLSGVMVGHISVPAIDKSGIATSLSPKTYDLLRKKLGFQGLIYTDAMGMKGAVDPKGRNNALMALRAGADVIECSNAHTDIAAIMAALKSGKLKRSVIEDRCKRVLAYKYALGLTRPYTVDAGQARAIGNDATADAVNRNLVAASMTCLVNRDNLLPLRDLDERSIAVVCLGKPADNAFPAYCRRYARCTVFNAPNGALTAAQLKQIKKYNTVIIGAFNHKAATKTAFNTLAKLPGAVGVLFNGPLRDTSFLSPSTKCQAVIEAYDNTALAGEYAAQAVFGGIRTDGRTPVAIPGIAESGDGIVLPKTRLGYTTPAARGYGAWLTDSIDSICNDIIARGGTPGIQVVVAKGNDIIVDGAYGKLDKNGPEVNNETMYDLASVSKALGTLPGIMMAVDSGYMDIDTPISQYIPGMRRDDKKDLLVKEFLFHETGMPPAISPYDIVFDTTTFKGRLITPKKDADHPTWIMPDAWGHKDAKLRKDLVSTVRTETFDRPIARGMWGSQATTDTLMNIIYGQKLRANKNYRYSCLNFCLLKDAEERATGVPHDKWADTRLWEPLGAWSITYNPADNGFDVSNIAPTEVDTYLRRQHLQGYVHDETAAFLGGVSGNAGLFANAGDLAKICRMWLNGGTYGGDTLMSPGVVKLFTTTKSPTCHRGLGFDKPNTERPEWSSTIEEAGPQVYGHTGYTGPVFWVDPKNDIIFIFLTNRVNPTRDSKIFNASGVRGKLFRQVLRALAPEDMAEFDRRQQAKDSQTTE